MEKKIEGIKPALKQALKTLRCQIKSFQSRVIKPLEVIQMISEVMNLMEILLQKWLLQPEVLIPDINWETTSARETWLSDLQRTLLKIINSLYNDK